jgi:hypothetical protein
MIIIIIIIIIILINIISDRFCDAMLSIRREIQDVINGSITAAESPLKGIKE